MFASILALLQDGDVVFDSVPFDRPDIDWHAAAPELVLLAVGATLTLIDAVFLERAKHLSASLAGFGLLLALIPIITLAVSGAASQPNAANGARFVLSDVDGYVVDGYSLILKALFIVIGYIVVLMSARYISEGDYWESEYYGLLVTSILGMVVMSSARDLITIFVALELLSIPAYLLAAWRKRDLRSNEAGLKYYLMGVFASAVMLYGMSLVFGVTGTTSLAGIGVALEDMIATGESIPIVSLGIIFVIIGFAFKVSAVPFHSWAPDTYEGAPTPVTAFLAVASKAAGFVALVNLVMVGFWHQGNVYQPLFWILAAASMTIGNLIALRQTNIVRLLAYSGIAQAGFMLAPLAVAGESAEVADNAASAIVTYLVIYAAMNLGAFAVLMAVARRTRTAEISSFSGLFQHSPVLAAIMTVFLASLAGIPPLGGWFAKFQVFTALVSAGTGWGYALAGIAAVNTVLAFGYYGRLASRMWVDDAPPQFAGRPISVPFALQAALGLTVAATLLFGIVPSTITHFTDIHLVSPLAFGG